MKVNYEGDLHTSGIHLKSGKQIETDAPIDNNGKGNAFSPTDLLCASLASCMMTLMGITAQSKGINLGHISCDIEKIMQSSPRKVSAIHLLMEAENLGYSDKEKEILKNAALSCPVAKSLDPSIEINLQLVWR